MTDGLHRLAELRSLAYHRAVAERVRVEPELVSRARRKLEQWEAEARIHPHYAAQWRAALNDPESLAELLTADNERARAARQCTPFAGVIPAGQRHRIWREERARWEAAR